MQVFLEKLIEIYFFITKKNKVSLLKMLAPISPDDQRSANRKLFISVVGDALARLRAQTPTTIEHGL
jgi:hypothetical protein